MMYRRLEARFAQQRPCGPGRRLRVINLALGDSMTYQNYIALNRWGHALQPDMILSFSGLNDINVTYRTRSDAYRDFGIIRAFNVIARHSSSPPWLKWLARLYPGFVKNTALGPAVRTLSLGQAVQASEEEYLRRFPSAPGLEDVVDRITKPLYVHALQSIKGDFGGIPIIVAFQPYTLTPDPPNSPSGSPPKVAASGH